MSAAPLDPRRIVPLHKSDKLAVRNLRRAGKARVLAHVARLLRCIADGNWPVARGVGDVLAPHALEMQPELIRVLRGTEGDWKRNCLDLLHDAPAAGFGEELRQELRLLAAQPTYDDQDEDVHEAARALFRRLEA